MRCEKLFYTYDLLSRRYLAVRATPGGWGLNDLALPLLRQALRCGNPDHVRALFDAGAGPPMPRCGACGAWPSRGIPGRT